MFMVMFHCENYLTNIEIYHHLAAAYSELDRKLIKEAFISIFRWTKCSLGNRLLADEHARAKAVQSGQEHTVLTLVIKHTFQLN